MRKEERENKFFERAKKAHGDKYDYSLVEYVNAHTKIKIVCPTHGVFEQEPDAHVRNHGCNICHGGVALNKKLFIEKSKNIHGKKYDYSKVEYTNNHIDIILVCKIHGKFKQKPNDHLTGYGCWECGVENRAKQKTDLARSLFIEKANKIHCNKYNYSKVKYINSIIKIEIICKKHGSFNQIPNSHLCGAGCPKCIESKGEERIRLFLQKNKIEFEIQKKFKECKNIRVLPFDFYLPELNICIEFDGVQHFKSGGFHRTEASFNNTIKKDKIKSEYCSGVNGRPKLIRISFKEYNKIEKILSKI